MTKCTYCYREGRECHNTRDMESEAIYGDRECFFQLARLGGGEMGLEKVVKLHEETVGAKANHIMHSFDPLLV